MDRTSRLDDARQNVSRWKSLLSNVKGLLSDATDLEDEIERSKERIDRTWEDTSREIEETRQRVDSAVDAQASERAANAELDGSEAGTPPVSVPAEDPIHGDPTLPSESGYEIPDPVTVEEIRADLDETEQQPARNRERPSAFTERAWFELHSNEFPLGEDLFAEGTEAAPETDTAADETREQVPERDRDRTRTEEDDR